MNQEDIIRMAREANIKQAIETPHLLMVHELERFAALVAAAERNKLAAWMIERGYATGHGDSTEDLLKELEWQIEESVRNEREACAKVCEILGAEDDSFYAEFSGATDCADAIRARENT
jgi:hypothetical protein